MIIAHVDMDSFFCSCEEKYDSSLKGKPVIVGATGQRGVVSTANYEARKFGLHSAMPISKARALCPEGVFLGGNYQLYRQESQQVMELLSTFATRIEQVSVDEAYLDLTSFAHQFKNLQEMGAYIRNAVFDHMHLPCSIGISNCRTVSKIASDYNKPFGVTVVESTPSFMQGLPIHKIPGIGKKSKNWYYQNDVQFVGDLMQMNRFKVLELFGMHGVRLQQIALGEVIRGFSDRDYAKSVSRERTFIVDCKDTNQLYSQLDMLCKKVYQDLSWRGYKKVSLKVRYSDFTTITRDSTLKMPQDSLGALSEEATHLFEKHVDTDRPIRLIGVKLSNLINDASKQMTLGCF